MALTGTVTLPTGEENDIDSLTDFPFGTGTYSLSLYAHNDYIGIKNFVFSTTCKYQWTLPHDERLRIKEDVNRPITANKEKVRRDLGDILELEVSGLYKFKEAFNFTLLYKYRHASKTNVSGDMDFVYKSMEEETNWTTHVFFTALGYSTLPKYLKKEFPVPMAVSLGYRNRFAGKNNVLASEYISLKLQVFFK